MWEFLLYNFTQLMSRYGIEHILDIDGYKCSGGQEVLIFSMTDVLFDGKAD